MVGISGTPDDGQMEWGTAIARLVARRLFKKFANTIFLLLVGHLAFCELTHRITTWMFYVIFLHILYKHDSPVPAGHEGGCPKPFLTDGNFEGY
jgi:hypothetical protein